MKKSTINHSIITLISSALVGVLLAFVAIYFLVHSLDDGGGSILPSVVN